MVRISNCMHTYYIYLYASYLQYVYKMSSSNWNFLGNFETQTVWVMCKLTRWQAIPLVRPPGPPKSKLLRCATFFSVLVDFQVAQVLQFHAFRSYIDVSFWFFFSLCAGKCALRRHNPPPPFHQFGVHEVSTEEHHWFQRQRGVQKCHVLPGQWWQAQLSLASVPLELLRKRQGKFDHSHNLRPTWRPFDRHVPSPLLVSWCLLGHGYLLHQWQLWRPHPKRAWRICHNMPLKFCQHQIEVDPCKERHSESYKWRVEVSIQMQARVLMCWKSWIQVTFERGALLSLVLLFFTKSSNMIHKYYSL